jgi:hypothetical protein
MLVPAVAATQVRLVLFIFIRFKGYLDGISNPKGIDRLEFYVRGKCRAIGAELKFFYTNRTCKGEDKPLCKN